MKSRLLGAVCACVFTLFTSSSVWSATVWDLASDWSDVSNLNGVWTYREGSNALPHVANIGAPLTAFNQEAWAGSGSVGSFLPLWAKLQVNPGDRDLAIGDVFMHSTDGSNGGGNGVGNVIWTSPIDGIVDVTGNAWMTRDIGRSNQWTLKLNGVALSGGNISSGDPYSRANPFEFINGSGGPSVLAGIPVSVGDVFRLDIVKTSGPGDFAGVNLTITETVVPIPPAVLLFGSGLLGLIGMARRKKA